MPTNDPDPDFDPEGPSPHEMDEHDDPDLMPCPHCRKMVTEDAWECPHCKRDLSPGAASSDRSLLFVVIVCALIAAMMGFIFIWG